MEFAGSKRMLDLIALDFDSSTPREDASATTMRRLILFRHAKAESPGSTADMERPLAERGRADAARIGAYLADQGLRPDAAIVSTSRRTRETWEFAAAALRSPPQVTFDDQLYEARAETILEVLRETPSKTRSLMLIGHNPGMEELARALAGTEEKEARRSLAQKFPTGGLAVIDFPVEAWSEVKPGLGRLVQYVTPKILAREE
jgi:phosphohistidine phosphatase